QVFHELLVGAADNAVLLDTYQSLSVHVQVARLYQRRQEVDYTESLREHRRIYEALVARDMDGAAAAVRAHIDGAERRLGAGLDEEGERSLREVGLSCGVAMRRTGRDGRRR